MNELMKQVLPLPLLVESIINATIQKVQELKANCPGRPILLAGLQQGALIAAQVNTDNRCCSFRLEMQKKTSSLDLFCDSFCVQRHGLWPTVTLTGNLTIFDSTTHGK